MMRTENSESALKPLLFGAARIAWHQGDVLKWIEKMKGEQK